MLSEVKGNGEKKRRAKCAEREDETAMFVRHETASRGSRAGLRAVRATIHAVGFTHEKVIF